MSRILRKQYVRSDLAAVQGLLGAIPQDDAHFLDRIGLESRAGELSAELSALADDTGKTAETLLYFQGEPVVGTLGIEAKFSADVLRSFQDLVSKQAAAQYGPVGSSGPIRAERESRLHITNVVHGSFGFELEEMCDMEPMFGPTPLANAVRDVARLLDAAKESDEVFADAAATASARVYDALRGFLSLVHGAGASFRMVTEEAEVRYDRRSLGAAVERASAERIEADEQPIHGTFLGVLLDSGRFEHRAQPAGDVIRGKISPDLDARSLVAWTDRSCVAHFHVVTLRRSGKEQRRYTLLKLEPPIETKS
jgi:hypothetical protein